MSTSTNSLDMSPEAMRQLGRKATDIIVDRTSRLADGNAREGEFRQLLEELFLKPPSDQGRAAKRGHRHPTVSKGSDEERTQHDRHSGHSEYRYMGAIRFGSIRCSP